MSVPKELVMNLIGMKPPGEDEEGELIHYEIPEVDKLHDLIRQFQGCKIKLRIVEMRPER